MKAKAVIIAIAFMLVVTVLVQWEWAGPNEPEHMIIGTEFYDDNDMLIATIAGEGDFDDPNENVQLLQQIDEYAKTANRIADKYIEHLKSEIAEPNEPNVFWPYTFTKPVSFTPEYSEIDIAIELEGEICEIDYDPNTHILSSTRTAEDTLRLLHKGIGTVYQYYNVPDSNDNVKVVFAASNKSKVAGCNEKADYAELDIWQGAWSKFEPEDDDYTGDIGYWQDIRLNSKEGRIVQERYSHIQGLPKNPVEGQVFICEDKDGHWEIYDYVEPNEPEQPETDNRLEAIELRLKELEENLLYFVKVETLLWDAHNGTLPKLKFEGEQK